jgi:predicted nicotinamide N-methyase
MPRIATKPTTDMKRVEKQLTSLLRDKGPHGNLKQQPLVQEPEIPLTLIEDSYPQSELTQSQIENLMDSPPYWAFCWASGQVMARHILDHPELVLDKTVVDFGSGSGVVAIAAAQAGARKAIALDIDPTALLACRLNSLLNKTQIEITNHLVESELDIASTLLLIADVFYDRDNIPMLDEFIRDYQDVIVADSRVKPSELKGLTEVARHASSTVPDLGESTDFNSVGIFRLHTK